MDNVLGIIAEYNPLHNGHVFHISQSKKLANADYTVCIMSGNFVQRGDTSLIDKWTKTEMALNNGIDLVIELPTTYATSSAEIFAEGAISILDSLKIVNTISFGSETNNLETLNSIASILENEPKEYVKLLNLELANGISFPKARENALISYLNDSSYSEVLSKPNNILGIEYLKAINKIHSCIQPIIVKRKIADYNNSKVIDGFASSTAIRNLLNSNDFTKIKSSMPSNSYLLFEEAFKRGEYIPNLYTFEKEIMYLLRTLSPKEISSYPDVSEGLQFSLKKAANTCNNLHDLIKIVKTKRYTQTRIQRILIHILLDIRKKDLQIARTIPPYVRVLGFNHKGKLLISEISKRNPNLSIITSVKKFMEISENKLLKHLVEKDIYATNIYTLGYKNKSSANLDYTHKLITL